MASDPQTPKPKMPKPTNASSLRRLGGRYDVIQQLGSGGFGQTFIARDRHLPDHPLCVVKQLQPRFRDEASLQTARRLFDTEARVLYRLGDHDQIPRLLAHFEEDQEFYLVQELIEGVPLSQEFLPNQPWPSDRVLALLMGILTGLAFVHDQQVIHRDLKPDNLMRRIRDGQIVLIDFGAVKQVTQTSHAATGQTNLTVSIGTQGYMPPEQISGNPRFSSDVYAVGMIGIQALTGCHPRTLNTDPHTGEWVWRDRAPQVSPALARILDRMVCYDFRDRYATAAEALAALQTLPPPTSPTVASPPPVVPTQVRPQSVPTPPVTDPTLVIPGLAVTPAATPSAPAQAASTVVLATPTGEQRSRRRLTVWLGSGTIIATTALLLLGRLGRSPAPSPQVVTAPTSVPETPIAVATSPSKLPTGTKPSASPTAASPTEPVPTEPVRSLLARAEQLRQADQAAAALDLYDRLLARDPENATAHWGRCYSLNRLQQFEAALAACDRALALDPDYPEAFWSKGYALEQQQQPAAALDLYQQATQHNPAFAAA
ncbi:protein kinase domain-containing protein [Trichothermofontia sp.]